MNSHAFADNEPTSILAIDIGGTKLAAGVVTRDGTLVRRATAPTPKTLDAEELFAALTTLIATVDTDPADTTTVGVGCGGPMSAHGITVSPLNIPAWRNFPLQERLQLHTNRPVTVDNDAKALARGEGWVGAARGVQNFIAMVVSTGVGGGIVLDGRMLDGSTGNAGHIGHIVVEPNGRPCACGARGCLEAEASGTAIAAFTGAHPREASAAVIEHVGTLVGRAVSIACNLLDLQLAVVAGSVALGYGDDFFAAAQRELDRLCTIEFSRGAVVTPGGLGDEGPLIGAAAVARAFS